MRKYLMLLTIPCIMVTACSGPILNPIVSDDGELISDITPAQGRGTQPEGASPTGSWTTRIMLATSSDGLSFTRTNEIIADQAGVPNVIVDHDGRIRIYYNDFGNGNIIAAAIQDDEGGWAYRKVTINNADRIGDPIDPTVVLMPDGQYRMYHTQGTASPFGPFTKIYSAISHNGIRFTADPGTRFAPGPPIFDPVVLKMHDDTWHLWVGPDGLFTGRSDDGLNFTSDQSFQVANRRFMTWAALTLSGSNYRIYGHFTESSNIVSSAFSSDGVSWSEETGGRLIDVNIDADLESQALADIGVAALPGGGYLMAYLAVIP